MKVAVSAEGNKLESMMDARFGRAAYFIIADAETMNFEALDNAAASAGGAGVTAAQRIVDQGVEAVITGNVGPNAMRVLNAADIALYRGASASVRQNLDDLNQGRLEKLDAAVPSHFGIGPAGESK